MQPAWTLVRRAAGALLAAAVAGCAARHPLPLLPATDAARAEGPDAADVARQTVVLFLAAEADGGPAADTLLAPGAEFIMTGIRVSVRPRLAGLNGPGRVTIEEGSVGQAGSFAWVVVSYRFEGRTEALGERARATFVLEKQRAGWKIRHVHSSMVERW